MPYYTPTGNPLYLNRGVSLVIRSEFILIQGAFGQVLTDINLRGLIAGQAWAGTHNFTGATITVPTQAPSDNTTKAASTAYVDAATGAVISGPLAAETAARIAADNLRGLIAGQVWAGTHDFTAGTINVPVPLAGNNATSKTYVDAGLSSASPVPPFVPSNTYTAGMAVFSLLNYQTYRHITATSALATDPANDDTNWIQVGIRVPDFILMAQGVI